MDWRFKYVCMLYINVGADALIGPSGRPVRGTDPTIRVNRIFTKKDRKVKDYQESGILYLTWIKI